MADVETGKPLGRDRATDILHRFLRPLLITDAQQALYWNRRHHDLRHLSLSSIVAAAFGLADVAERAGHGSPLNTGEVYAHAISGKDQQAAEVLGRLFSAELTPDATVLAQTSSERHSLIILA